MTFAEKVKLSGLAVVLDEHCPKTAQFWEPPKCRFVEYEKKDERWCRFFGIGNMRPGVPAFMVNGRIVIHPEVWDRLKDAPA